MCAYVCVCVCVLRGLNIAFCALPSPLSCSVMNKLCLNQIIRHNLQLARHVATDMSAIGLGNDCIHLKLSDKPKMADLIAEGYSIINAPLLKLNICIMCTCLESALFPFFFSFLHYKIG